MRFKNYSDQALFVCFGSYIRGKVFDICKDENYAYDV